MHVYVQIHIYTLHVYMCMYMYSKELPVSLRQWLHLRRKARLLIKSILEIVEK